MAQKFSNSRGSRITRSSSPRLTPARWRSNIPVLKTHKTPEIAKLQIANGAIGITCAKLGEAEVMADAGIDDILIAYPFFGDIKTQRLLALMEKARIIVSVDSFEASERISAAMTKQDRSIEVYIEVNTGQDRSGLRWGTEAETLAIDVARKPGLLSVGLGLWRRISRNGNK